MAVNICTKFEPKIILSQEPEDLERRLTYQNNLGGHSISIETPSIIVNYIVLIKR